ncbi:MAG: nuclear transport factor 2 family protein [Acidobacteriota bacterium]
MSTNDAERARRNKDTVRHFFRLLEAEDISGFVQLFAEEGRQINPYASGLFPDGATGRKALMEYWRGVPDLFDGMRFPIDELHCLEAPDRVFARYRGELTLKGGAGLYANDYYSTFRFNDAGQILEYVEIFNPIVAAKSFGLMDQLMADGNEEKAMPEQVAVANTVARYFAAVDGREWEELERLMTSPFFVDYSSFGGGEPAHLEPAAILAAWRQLLPGFDQTHHLIGNLDIRVDGPQASVLCKGTASHHLDGQVWTVIGSYDLQLRLDDGAWRVAGCRFLFDFQTGASDLAQKAQERAAL